MFLFSFVFLMSSFVLNSTDENINSIDLVKKYSNGLINKPIPEFIEEFKRIIKNPEEKDILFKKRGNKKYQSKILKTRSSLPDEIKEVGSDDMVLSSEIIEDDFPIFRAQKITKLAIKIINSKNDEDLYLNKDWYCTVCFEDALRNYNEILKILKPSQCMKKMKINIEKSQLYLWLSYRSRYKGLNHQLDCLNNSIKCFNKAFEISKKTSLFRDLDFQKQLIDKLNYKIQSEVLIKQSDLSLDQENIENEIKNIIEKSINDSSYRNSIEEQVSMFSSSSEALNLREKISEDIFKSIESELNSKRKKIIERCNYINKLIKYRNKLNKIQMIEHHGKIEDYVRKRSEKS